MKFDNDVMARLQAATQQLMKDGPLAATASLRQAFSQQAGNTRSQAPAGNPPPMKDLNPPPAGARPAGSAPGHTPPPADPPAASATAAMPDIAAMLARHGIKLPDMPNLADLPNMGRGAGMPAGRKRPAPPPLPVGARWLEATYRNQAGQRDYKLYVPSNYTGQPMPLVVMLHGCTQDPDDFAAGTRMNQLAEEAGCLVVWPAQPQHANNSRCWNWFSAADQQRDQGEPSLIAGIVRQVMGDYAVDPARISIAGLSAGGAMAAIVGTLYPDLFHAVGVHSGLPFGAARDLPGALQAMRTGAAGHRPERAGPKLIVFHGDKDGTVHPANGEHVLAAALAPHDGHSGEASQGKAKGGRRYTRTLHRAPEGTVLAEHWVLHGGGHAWAGGSAAGSYTDPTGPDASREMLRFFE